jgi:putative flippase GtrA
MIGLLSKLAFSNSVTNRLTVIRFLAVGGCATVGYIAVCYFLQVIPKWPPFWASIAAYCTMFAFSYVAQRNFTFRSPRQHRSSLPLYAGLQIACGLLASVLVQWLVISMQVSALVASSVVAGLSAAVSYIISASCIFPKGREVKSV